MRFLSYNIVQNTLERFYAMKLSTKELYLNDKMVSLITLQSGCMVSAEICSLGTSLTKLCVPDRKGHADNVVLSLAEKKTAGRILILPEQFLARTPGASKTAF